MPDPNGSFFGPRYRPVRLILYGGVTLILALFISLTSSKGIQWESWVILGNGLFLITVMVLYFFQNLRHSVQVENLLESLTKANAALRKEMDERQKLEEQLRQAQKMEAVGLLAGGIAHDFNNLLTVINGTSEMQLRDLPAENPARADFEEILAAGEQAAFLVTQLLTFSRRQKFTPRIVDLSEIVLDMDRMFRRLVPANIEVVTIPAETACTVSIDPGYFQQVLANLVVNARDAMPKGGKLVIQTQNVTLSWEDVKNKPDRPPGDYGVLTVSDTGIGMTKEVLSRIFEPFFTTKERGKGTGLGLATCYGIVKQSQGSIEVESEPGQGTSFHVFLPRAQGLVQKLLRPDDSQVAPRGVETVLLVEDEALVRNFALRVLRYQGYQVIEAASGEEALHYLESNPNAAVHLLLTDIVMPGMDGRELADKLRSLKPGLKILLTSGYTEHISGVKDASGNGGAFLAKPFSPYELARKVREVLDR
jgi:signal transduction histidine kinase